MTLPVFYSSTLDGLRGAEAHHVQVKRITVGEKIVLVDGQGRSATCTVTAVSKDAVEVDVEHIDTVERAQHITVVQALPKSERSELTVDLLTQAGADTIIPWQASRSIAKWAGKEAKAHTKWEKTVTAAAKQCRRAWWPEVAQLHRTRDVITLIEQHIDQGRGPVLVLHETADQPLRSMDLRGDIMLIVGPEGGISPEEYEAFTRAGGRAAKLGPEILRTATAGFAALAGIGALTRW